MPGSGGRAGKMTGAVDMVEKVARAIVGAMYHPQPDMSGDIWKAVSPRHRRDATDAARAAIEAMREPTEAMKDAGSYFDHDGDGGISAYEAADVWSGMIDAALNTPANHSEQVK